MKILFVAAEAAPIAKVGGMGDVVGALPKVLKKLGHDVRIMLPYYGYLPEKLEIPSESVWQSNCMGHNFDIFETKLPDTDIPLYLLGHNSFSGSNIYGGHDEHWRFTFFANAGAELAWNYWTPDIVHCHDWHTAMIPVWMQDSPDIQTIFTIHNLAYQGPSRHALQHMTWCPDHMRGDNAMAAALYSATFVNAVSPNYAMEIKTPEYGENLHHVMCEIEDKLKGIVNGIDVDKFNPKTDGFIEQKFNSKSLDKRIKNKLKLQEDSGLEVNKDTFLVGMISRLVEQKGIDLLLQVMERFLGHTSAQLLILGTGEHFYESKLAEISARYQNRVSVQIVHNERISRRIYSGIDAFLMPSRFEPCGISQLLAMRYGAIPIVRETGGLIDTVKFFDPTNECGTGYCFRQYDALDFYTCMIRAYEGYRFNDKWRKLQIRAMNQDFSWKKSASKYLEMYQDAIDRVYA